MNDIVTPITERPFVITHRFHAPLDRVWRAWSDLWRLRQWFGPVGITISTAHLDFRPGGTFHYCMHTPDGRAMWGRFAYREIMPRRRIVFVNSFSDVHGGITRHPFKVTWPLELLTNVTFASAGDYTQLTVEWLPINALPEERQTFATSQDSMQQGWFGTFGRLTGHLAS
jgi:uncharacterized protein YndB with AHSA1/START domain